LPLNKEVFHENFDFNTSTPDNSTSQFKTTFLLV